MAGVAVLHVGYLLFATGLIRGGNRSCPRIFRMPARSKSANWLCSLLLGQFFSVSSNIFWGTLSEQAPEIYGAGLFGVTDST